LRRFTTKRRDLLTICEFNHGGLVIRGAPHDARQAEIGPDRVSPRFRSVCNRCVAKSGFCRFPAFSALFGINKFSVFRNVSRTESLSLSDIPRPIRNEERLRLKSCTPVERGISLEAPLATFCALCRVLPRAGVSTPTEVRPTNSGYAGWWACIRRFSSIWARF
jgi:hypothetical protein